MARKTIDITTVVDTANSMLENSRDDMTVERQAISTFLETLLHKGNVYRGYSYLPGTIVLDEERNATITDKTRRRYHKITI